MARKETNDGGRRRNLKGPALVVAAVPVDEVPQNGPVHHLEPRALVARGRVVDDGSAVEVLPSEQDVVRCGPRVIDDAELGLAPDDPVV